MTKRTPGPCHHCASEYKLEATDFGLCCVCERNLIALRVIGEHWAIKAKAAPELLEALKELEALRKMPHPSGDLNAAVAYRQRERDAVALSKAAIAKAEGKPDEAV